MNESLSAPPSRVRLALDRPLRPDGEYVLYWMIAARRTRWSFALQHAIEHARSLGRPLLVLEGLRAGHRWNTARVHRFVMDGMIQNRRRFTQGGVRYLPYVEPSPGAGKGLLGALAERACVVVTDDAPAYFLPRMIAAAASQLSVRLEAVDGYGVMPLGLPMRQFTTAASFRRVVHKAMPDLFEEAPVPEPLDECDGGWAPVPASVVERWPMATDEELGAAAFLAGLPLDHEVPPVDETPGGSERGEGLAERVLRILPKYVDDGRHPDREATSGLSPYLHFGHVSSHEVVHRILEDQGWHPGRIGHERVGRREGFYGLSGGAEGFLDELITWRELGAVFSRHEPGRLESYEGLPDWARATLAEHRGDVRPWQYERAEFEAAATHEPLWNACQNQLRTVGRVDGYLRMVWGKMVLGWSEDPEEAFRTLLELNDRWALDGRSPNGASGVAWCFGRFDRAWGPERPVFGKVRYMTCDATRRKLKMSQWMERYGE